jgi:multimeric flavodoxin WrbA
MKPHLLIINGSLGGRSGNTAHAIRAVLPTLEARFKIRTLHLAEKPTSRASTTALAAASAFLFTTGTYWDSWGSPLQIFLEKTTKFEASPIWSGKPAAVLVTMHSVGGKEVLSRLQGVLSTLGLVLPPMTGLTYSMVNHELAKLCLKSKKTPASSEGSLDFTDDLWSLDDFATVAHNLHAYCVLSHSATPAYQTWAVDRADPARRWLK